MSEQRKRGRLLAASIATLMVAGGAGTAAATGAASPESAARAGAKPVSVRTLTLVTGDQVELTTFASGKEGVAVRPGPGREHVPFTYQSRGDSLSVIPSDALDLLRRGAVDARLFDVKALEAMGYDDASRATLPLMVRYHAGGQGRYARSAIGRLTAPKATLKSVNADAIVTQKTKAGEAWEAMTEKQGASRALASGVSRIWLDGAVKASLDQSAAQIGAPDAWHDGLTGSGVLTAVLDTGIDPAHPDLADAVATSQDFTHSANGTMDGHGHGTHVASIITGDGSASSGRYAGVAPDTRLLVGKVLDNRGEGSESATIAGMEWATSHGAKVVNMSLSASATDGTDPMSQAVNSLTASTGALFVVAAGNAGLNEKVSSPASADAALAVGAVDADDQLADFSSHGPRLGDSAVKPEITAPGVGIAAARAAGTSLGDVVDEHYTRLNGTSMATPHVAGAAALLAQQHPDWDAAQLKDVLTSTAKPTTGLDAFAQGSGRVDLTRAVRQEASATPGTLSNYLKWPHTTPVKRTVTYHNDGDEPLTLSLGVTLDGSSENSGLITPDAAQLTVPAHGTAAALLTIDPSKAAPGTYSGVLTARSADGQTVIRTALSVLAEDEVYDTKIRLIDRAGQTLPSTSLGLINLDTGEGFPTRVVGDDFVGRVPKGRYTVNAAIFTETADEAQSVTLVSQPDVEVSSDTTVQLDARAGKTVQADVGVKTKANTRWIGISETIAGTMDEFRVFTQDPETELYAVGTPAVTSRPYTFVHLATLHAPAVPGRPQAAYNLALTRDGGIPADPSFQVRSDELAKVHVRYHTQGGAAPATRSNLASIDDSNRASGGGYSVELASEHTEYFTATGRVKWLGALDTGTSFETRPLTPYKPGSGFTEEWNKAAISPAVSDASRCENFLFAPIQAFSTSAAGHLANAFEYTGTATLLHDGTEVGTTDDPRFALFTDLPSGPARYTLRLAAHHNNPAASLATKVDAEWTFSSAEPEEGCQKPHKLPLLSTRIGAGFDLNNTAPADKLLPVTINVERADTRTPDVKALTFETTFDDGATWHKVPVYGRGPASFSAIVPPVSTSNGYVGLRTTATDTDGNQLKQTVLRAYRLR
ncbi:S8 family serine peptidase [Streptomyces sp. TX20-6-3]|uniref:S8 family serine peptidase n=1 Tax=Streptomyces sp. TX20-6-3 TaxID=3028705 RepID=UPI0029BD0775|nr:S8 family serine peptidase [Streptomyces sp. TX20-6-3]MDX2565357.1 S8 family serine peptidase [Streptomyces sp. TX20-6-3]